METKKFKIVGSENAKGGKNNTRTTLSASGISAIAGVAVGAALRSPEEPVQEEHDGHDAEPVAQNHEEAASQQEPVQPQQEQPQQVTDNITEPQPVDNSQANTNPSSPTANVTSQEDAAPEEVAMAILKENQIDSNDIEGDNVFTMLGFQNVNGPDGEEILVAVVQAQDGSQFILADIDGDGVYTQVFDLAGNYAGEAEGNLTVGDLVVMSDNSGSYIAAVEDIGQGDDPSQGIVDTEQSSSSNLLASNDNADADDVSGVDSEIASQLTEEELLAELTRDLDEEETSLLDRIIEDVEGVQDSGETEVEDLDTDANIAENDTDDLEDDINSDNLIS